MKFVINFHVRRFKRKENDDSGYYRPIKHKKNQKVGRIDINLADDPLEQALTIFHEVTHLVFDIFAQYETDYKSKRLKKRPRRIKTEWRYYNEKMEKRRKDEISREEFICCKVEAAVRRIFIRFIPKKFKKSLFTKK